MRMFLIIGLLYSISVVGQDSLDKEKATIYSLALQTFGNKKVAVIDETFTPINKYDIDGNYQRWFYGKFPRTMAISLVPIEYEMAVLSFLHSKGVTLDTSSIFQQIDFQELDSISKYVTSSYLISFKRAPLHHSFFRNLLKKKMALGLSPIVFDNGNQIALVKLQVYSKKMQVVANPSKIIILQKQSGEWQILGSISNRVA